jgi:hypothetical protein
MLQNNRPKLGTKQHLWLGEHCSREIYLETGLCLIYCHKGTETTRMSRQARHYYAIKLQARCAKHLGLLMLAVSHNYRPTHDGKEYHGAVTILTFDTM